VGRHKRQSKAMKVVIQRSKEASVLVENEVVGEIEFGMVLFVCLELNDDLEKVKAAAEKILALRIFEDDNGKMGKNICDAQGQILAISQFTLSWDGKKGHRPSFDQSMPPLEAQILFKLFCDEIRTKVEVATGKFGAMMEVCIKNSGPVTFSLSF